MYEKIFIFSIIIDVLVVILFKNYIFISNISILPAFLFVFSLLMGILYTTCKGDVLSFHIAPYTDEKNGATNNIYMAKSYFITVPIYFLLMFFFNNILKVCLSSATLYGTIIGYLFVISKIKHKEDNKEDGR